jgi:hypothetical protein
MHAESAVSAWESPELVRLFHTYTASPESIGAHLGRLTARGAEFDPLIVATGTDIALYPGDGAAPIVEPFRMSTRGFKELAAISHLGARMFDRYPGWRPDSSDSPHVHPDTGWVHEKPKIRRPEDWLALITRLRVVMEDPRQLLSGAVTDYASRQLVENDNDPSAINVPGLDDEAYPHLPARRGPPAAVHDHP